MWSYQTECGEETPFIEYWFWSRNRKLRARAKKAAAERPPDERWTAKLVRLHTYLRSHGGRYPIVKTADDVERKLGVWVNIQRQARHGNGRYTMTEARATQLQELLGWAWGKSIPHRPCEISGRRPDKAAPRMEAAAVADTVPSAKRHRGGVTLGPAATQEALEEVASPPLEGKAGVTGHEKLTALVPGSRSGPPRRGEWSIVIKVEAGVGAPARMPSVYVDGFVWTKYGVQARSPFAVCKRNLMISHDV